MNTQARKDLAADAEALIYNVQREGRAFASEQPLVFDPAFDGRFVTLEQDGQVVSACSVLPRDLVVAGGRVRVGLIGSVSTAPEYRKRGLAAEVLRRAEAELAADGAMFAMLWADDSDFYTKRGYTPLGTELDYAMSREQIQHLPPAEGVRAYQPSDAVAVHALYCEHEARMARSLSETAALLAGPSIDARVREVEGVVVAYALVGRGEDLDGVLHEWGGELQDALAVFRAHLETLDEKYPGLWVMCPTTHLGLREHFEQAECLGMVGILGMARLLDAGAAARLIDRNTPDEVEAVADGRGVVLRGPAGQLRMNDQETLFALFPPKAARDVVDVLETELGAELPGLPLQAFAWGLDSI